MHLAGVKQYWRAHTLKNRVYVKIFQYVTLTNRNYHHLLFKTDLRYVIPSYSPTHTC